MLSCSCQCYKFLTFGRFPGAVAHDSAQIRCSRVMASLFILHIQSIGCHKMRIYAAEFLRFLIHPHCKGFHRSVQMLCNRVSTIIVRFQHQPIQQIPQIKLFVFLHSKMYLGLSRSRCAYRHNVIRISVFQSKNACHNLRGARVCKRQ